MARGSLNSEFDDWNSNTAADELGASFWFLDDGGQQGALVLARGDSTNDDLFAYLAPADPNDGSFDLLANG